VVAGFPPPLPPEAPYDPTRTPTACNPMKAKEVRRVVECVECTRSLLPPRALPN